MDKDDRIDCLRKIRRILDAFFDAPLNYYTFDSDKKIKLAESSISSIDAAAFDVWKKHEDSKGITETYIPIDIELDTQQQKKAIDSVVAKRTKNTIKEKIHYRNMDGYQFARMQ